MQQLYQILILPNLRKLFVSGSFEGYKMYIMI